MTLLESLRLPAASIHPRTPDTSSKVNHGRCHVTSRPRKLLDSLPRDRGCSPWSLVPLLLPPWILDNAIRGK